MAVSLSKGQLVSLEKAGSGPAKVRMGLGWDPVKKKGGFLSGLLGGGGGGDIDLDASCIVFNGARGEMDLVWFNQLKSKDGSIIHTGDNLTGEGEGDDEVIMVDIARLPAQATHLVFLVNSFRGQTFDEVENAFCRVVDDGSGQELCRYTLAEKGRHTGVVMGVLSRVGATWSFKAIGAPTTGRTAKDMVQSAVSHI